MPRVAKKSYHSIFRCESVSGVLHVGFTACASCSGLPCCLHARWESKYLLIAQHACLHPSQEPYLWHCIVHLMRALLHIGRRSRLCQPACRNLNREGTPWRCSCCYCTEALKPNLDPNVKAVDTSSSPDGANLLSAALRI